MNFAYGNYERNIYGNSSHTYIIVRQLYITISDGTTASLLFTLMPMGKSTSILRTK